MVSLFATIYDVDNNSYGQEDNVRALIILFLSFVSLSAFAQSKPPAGCLPSDTFCVLTQAVDAIDPSKIKYADDQKVVTWLASKVAPFGNNELSKKMLKIVQELPDNAPLSAGTLPVPGSSSFIEKMTAEALLLAALDRVPESIKVLQTLKDNNAGFFPGFEPQKDVVETLIQLGKIDAAQEYIRETRLLYFKRLNGVVDFVSPKQPQNSLIVALLNQNKLDKALEVFSLLKEDNVFSTSSSREGVRELFALYYRGKGKKEKAKEMVADVSLGCAAAQNNSPDSAVRNRTPEEIHRDQIDAQIISEKDKIISLIQNGHSEEAQNYFNNLGSREIGTYKDIILANVRFDLARGKTNQKYSAEVYSFYLRNCTAEPYYKAVSLTHCVLEFLDSSKQEESEPEKFFKKYGPQCKNGYVIHKGLK